MSGESDRNDIEETIDGLRRSITSNEQFLQLLALLRKDLAKNKKDWENQTLEGYLEALGAFCGCLESYYRGRGVNVDLENPGWRVFADILLAARVYE